MDKQHFTRYKSWCPVFLSQKHQWLFTQTWKFCLPNLCVSFFLFETQNLISLINVGYRSVCNLDLYIALFFYLYTDFLLQQNDLALIQTHQVLNLCLKWSELPPALLKSPQSWLHVLLILHLIVPITNRLTSAD